MGECCGEKPGRFVRVIKKISKTKVPGPEPLAQSSFRRPKKVLGMQIPRGYAPPKIDPNVMDYRISKVSKKPAPTSRPSSPTPSGRYLPGDAKVRMHFPDASHERSAYAQVSYDDTPDSGQYGASMHPQSAYSPVQLGSPPQIQWTPPSAAGVAGDGSSAYRTPRGRDQREPDLSFLQTYLDEVEERERNLLRQNVQEFQQARRKLIMDKRFYETKGGA